MSIMVSISCITYNHEKYIARALQGFLSQQTDFNYEILIHDDASTDHTAAIIREYAAKYPDMIKPILQTENQYSKGTRIGAKFNYPRAQGTYTALCEGDDFWTDPLKLKKQVEWMESHPGYSLCFHSVDVVDSDGKSTGTQVRPYHGSQTVPIDDIIIGVGEYHRTCSLLARTEYLSALPEFFFNAPAGDLALILYLASQGSVYFLDDTMAAYRAGIPGSWTSQLAESTQQQIRIRTRLLQMFDDFNKFTNFQYAGIIARRQHRTRFLLSVAKGDIRALKAREYREYRDEISRYLLVKIFLRKHLPAIYHSIRKKYRRFHD